MSNESTKIGVVLHLFGWCAMGILVLSVLSMGLYWVFYG